MLPSPPVRPGRPRKFGRPSRPVTVTLPEDVLRRLAALNSDLGRAIVTLAERRLKTRVPKVRHAELASYGNHAVIIVNPAKALTRLAGVQLVPIGDGRALISLDRLKSISQLELDVRDVLERGLASDAERDTLQALAEILRVARRASGVALEERTIIVLEKKRLRRRAG